MANSTRQQTLTNLGQRIKEARIAAGFTQTDVGRYIGVTKQTISQWETGRAPPMVTNLMRFAEFVGVDPSELFHEVALDLDIKQPIQQRLAAASSIIPIYGLHVAGAIMTKRAVHNVQPNGYLATRTRHAPKSLAFEVRNNANAPKLLEGDVVTIDSELPPEPGQFVFALVNGEFYLRRYLPKDMKTHVGAILRADNRMYPDMVMSKSDALLGTVREINTLRHD